MQLFVTDFEVQGDVLYITEKTVCHQLKNVLRAKKGYEFAVQKFTNNEVIRYKVGLLQIDKDKVQTKILEKNQKKGETQNYGVIIPTLNSYQKMELLVQKLTEIGIPNIVFAPLARSVIKTIAPNKMQRMQKICTEAIEQSWSWTDTKLIFTELFSFISDKKLIVFDFQGQEYKTLNLPDKENIYAIIGPEGGFAKQDMDLISKNIYAQIQIGDNVLRAETAGIIAGFLLQA